MTMTASRLAVGLLLAVAASGGLPVLAFAPARAPSPPVGTSSAATRRAASDADRAPAPRAAASASAAAAALAGLSLSLSLLLHPLPAHADGQTKEFKLPPIDRSARNRCVLNSSKMGQANAARDALYDLRECDIRGVKGNEFDLSGVIMTKTDATKAQFREAQVR